MSVYNIIESNNLNLLSESHTIKKVKIDNTSDGINYTQQLQNKNGTIALNSDIIDSESNYGSIIALIDTNYSFSSNISYQLLYFISTANSQILLSNFMALSDHGFYSGLKYIGTTQKKLKFVFSSSITGIGSSVTLDLRKNGTSLNNFVIINSFSSPACCYMECIIDISNNDEIQLYHKSSNLQNISFKCPSFLIIDL